MPTAKHVRDALDKAVTAHQTAHHGPLETAGLPIPEQASGPGSVDEGAYTDEGDDDGG